MTDEPEYVFMAYETLQRLRREGKATSVEETTRQRGQPKFAYYEGKRVLTTKQRVGMIPEGEVLSEAPEHVKEHIRETIWRPHWPLPECLRSAE